MTLTNFPNGVSSFGVPLFGLGGLIPVPGDVYWVDPVNGSDNSDGLDPTRPKLTLSSVHTAMTTDQNDTAVVLGAASATTGSVRESSALTWSKDLCHIVGTAHNLISHRVSIRATSGQNFTPLVSNSADGCVFANFHVFHGYAVAETQVAWAEAGQRNVFYKCHIAGMGNATAGDQAGGRSITLTGDGERYLKDCVIGLDTVARSTTNAEIGFLSAAVRDVFEDCRVITFADNIGHFFVDASSSGCIDRFVHFKRCLFFNAVRSTATNMTAGMNIHASAGGAIILEGSQILGVTDWANNFANLYIEGLPTATNTLGIMTVAT